MQNEQIQKIVIEQLLPVPAAEKLKNVLDTISSVQQGLYAFVAGNDSEKLNILKIGTVFRYSFLILLQEESHQKT